MLLHCSPCFQKLLPCCRTRRSWVHCRINLCFLHIWNLVESQEKRWIIVANKQCDSFFIIIKLMSSSKNKLCHNFLESMTMNFLFDPQKGPLYVLYEIWGKWIPSALWWAENHGRCTVDIKSMESNFPSKQLPKFQLSRLEFRTILFNWRTWILRNSVSVIISRMNYH